MEIEKVVSIIKQAVNQQASIVVSKPERSDQCAYDIGTRIISIKLGDIAYQQAFSFHSLEDDAVAMHAISYFLRNFASLYCELYYQSEIKE